MVFKITFICEIFYKGIRENFLIIKKISSTVNKLNSLVDDLMDTKKYEIVKIEKLAQQIYTEKLNDWV
jgi:hypothetical protein